jgi:hypothetical protein
MNDLVPTGYVPLADAVTRITQSIFGDERIVDVSAERSIIKAHEEAKKSLGRTKSALTQQTWALGTLRKRSAPATVPPGVLERDDERVRETSAGQREAAARVHDWENQQAAGSRHLMQLMLDGVVPTWVITSQGENVAVPQSFWASVTAPQAMTTGRAHVGIAAGRVIVLAAELEAALAPVSDDTAVDVEGRGKPNPKAAPQPPGRKRGEGAIDDTASADGDDDVGGTGNSPRNLRKRDPEADALLRNGIETVLAGARVRWPKPGTRPSYWQMAKLLCDDKKFKSAYGEDAIRKILAGTYRVSRRLGIVGLTG